MQSLTKVTRRLGGP